MKSRSSKRALVLCAILGGCGGGSEGSGAFTTGFSKSELVNELAKSDREKICRSVRESLKNRIARPDVICPSVGVSGAIYLSTDPTAPATPKEEVCKTFTDVCREDFNSDDVDTADFKCSFENEDVASCAVPIGLVEECVNATFDQVESNLRNVQCSLSEQFETIEQFRNFLINEKEFEKLPPCAQVKSICDN